VISWSEKHTPVPRGRSLFRIQLLDQGVTFLALAGEIQIESGASGWLRSFGGAEQRGGSCVDRVGAGPISEDFFEVLVDRAVVVDHEDASVGFHCHGWISTLFGDGSPISPSVYA